MKVNPSEIKLIEKLKKKLQTKHEADVIFLRASATKFYFLVKKIGTSMEVEESK